MAQSRKAFPAQKLETNLAPGLPLIRGDSVLLGQVLFNLLDNAGKYGGGEPVSIYARAEKDELVLSVVDMGKGIPAKDLDRIFEKFYRRGKVDGRAPGTGLGLAIARGFVEAMGGTIRGRKPCAEAAWHAHHPALSDRNARASRMSDYRILVVDDEPQIQRFLRPALTAAGYDVIEAETGAAAMKAIATAAPDIVILDLGLPDMDGKDDRAPGPQLVAAADHHPLGARPREREDRGARPRRRRLYRKALRHRRTDSAYPHGAPASAETGWRRDAFPSMDLRSMSCGARSRATASRSTSRPRNMTSCLLLARHAGKVVTHRTLLTSVWGPAHADDMHYLRVFIGQVRTKIERDPAAPKIIRTEPGVGYRFLAE